jgi:hypothetical protein
VPAEQRSSACFTECLAVAVWVVMKVSERRRTHKLGNGLVEGVQLRSLPPAEQPWITTFNLRWWRYADEETSRHTKEPRGQAGTPA